jgi:hypothetical protein
MTKSIFFHTKSVFYGLKKDLSQTFWTSSNIKKVKVQLSKLYPTYK